MFYTNWFLVTPTAPTELIVLYWIFSSSILPGHQCLFPQTRWYRGVSPCSPLVCNLQRLIHLNDAAWTMWRDICVCNKDREMVRKTFYMCLLPDTQNRGLRMRRECRERFLRHRLHVPWCMSGSLNRGGEENVPGIPGACATRNFTYLARGPWRHRQVTRYLCLEDMFTARARWASALITSSTHGVQLNNHSHDSRSAVFCCGLVRVDFTCIVQSYTTDML